MAKRQSDGGNLPSIPSQWQTLKLPNGRTIRITPDKRASVLDAIEAATGARNPRSIWDRLKREFPILLTKVDEWQFPGPGQRLTPVTNREGFIEILALLPGSPGDRTRHELVDKYTRYLDGDVSMIEEMIDRQDDPEALKRVELRAKTKRTNKLLNAAIEEHSGRNHGRYNIFADVGGRNNQAIYGTKAKAIQAAGGKRSTRDNAIVGNIHLQLMATTEELEVHHMAQIQAQGNHIILGAVDTVCQDMKGLRQKYAIPDLPVTG